MTTKPPGSTGDAEDRGAVVFTLTEALCRIPAMHRTDFRASLIQAIGRQLGDPLSPMDGESPRVHIFNIVWACDDRPGGIAALARSVGLLAGDDSEALRFCSLATPAEALVGPEDESRLREPLEQCVIPDIPRLFSIAVEGMVGIPSAVRNAWDAFVRLADINVRTDGVPPHLAFVELLATLLRDTGDSTARSRAGILRTWVTEQIGRCRASGDHDLAERLQQFRAQAATPTGPGSPMTLIIMLDADLRTGPGHYVVTHWRQMDPVRWRPERLGDETVVSESEIPGTVAWLLRTAEREWAGRFGGPLNLELILPTELLNLAADQWSGEDASDPASVPIGTEYEVVLRSQQRLCNPGWHRPWIRRSQALSPGTPPHDAHHVVHRAPPELAGNARRLRLHLNSKELAVAYLLSSPPDFEPGRSELAAALRAGLPIVLWSRDPAAQTELWEAVNGKPPRELPGRVKEIRTKAALGTEPAMKFGHHISLIWDSYDRFIDLTRPFSTPL